jgi:aspartyl-tRNA(Asn)/glutamyl-tRNA(Gln) amidotransferase subunit B
LALAQAARTTLCEDGLKSMATDWEIVIGLETHVQLETHSKMFSGASTAFGAAPNTQACPLDLALPGTLPVPNRAAVECAIRFGLAVGAQIAPQSVFARKNYFYPDLPKGYQISQYELPVVVGGSVAFLFEAERGGSNSVEHRVELTRAHLEEDAGKSLHEGFGDPRLTAGLSGIDLNRAGTPLLEIVTEPVMRSAREAVAYARTLHSLVVWLGICDGNMQQGSFRVDANVSVRPRGQAAFGTRCEIKNLNSFRFLQAAIEIEAARQIELIEDGGRVIQATRLYDPDRNETREMRSKEDAHDYRYFPDPDLPPLVVDPAWIERVRTEMPELPGELAARFEQRLGLSAYDARTLTADRATAVWFEAALLALTQMTAQESPAAQASADTPTDPRLAKLLSNWMLGDLAAALNRDECSIDASRIEPGQLAAIVLRIADGTIHQKMARTLFAELWSDPRSSGDARAALAMIDQTIEARGFKQTNDAGALEAAVDTAIAANAKSVAEFRAGKEKALNAIVGQVMKATGGQANPGQVTEILRRKLGA